MKKSAAKREKKVQAKFAKIVAENNCPNCDKVAKKCKCRPSERAMAASAEKVAGKPTAANYPTPRIITDESGAPYFACGAVKFPIDGRDLSATLGLGWQSPTGKRKDGWIDRLNDRTWQSVLEHHGLPTKPWSRDLARKPLCRIIQRAYYAHYDADVLKRNDAAEKDNWLDRDNICFQQYKTAVQAYATQAESRVATLRKSGGGHRFVAKAVTYSVAAPLKKAMAKKDAFKGQQALIVNYLRKHQEDLKPQEVADALDKGGFKANQPTIKVVNHYFYSWKKVGWLTTKETAAPEKGEEKSVAATS